MQFMLVMLSITALSAGNGLQDLATSRGMQ